MIEKILQELLTIDEALAIVTARLDSADRISDVLLREVSECVDNIREAVSE